MLFRNAVKLAQMPFCLTPKVLNPVNVILLFSKMCVMIDAEMIKLTHIQNVIAFMVIRINNAVWLNLFADNQQ